MFSTTIPEYEVHLSAEPVAFMMFPVGRKIKPFKIKPKGNYFVLYNKYVKGVYEIKADNPAWMWGKTAVYFCHVSNSTNFDPIIVDQINQFMRRNKLSKIKRKDVKHASLLRNIITNVKKQKAHAAPIDVLQAEINEDRQSLDQNIEDGMKSMQDQLDVMNKENQSELTLSEPQQMTFLLDYLQKQKKLDPAEHATFIYKINNDLLDFKGLIEELRDMSVITINEPLDLRLEGFLEDFGAQNPSELAGFVDDMRDARKGLKTLTAAPVKSFIPAATLFAVILGVIFGIILIPQYLPDITEGINKSMNQGGGFKLPFGGGFNFFYQSLPDWMLRFI